MKFDRTAVSYLAIMLVVVLVIAAIAVGVSLDTGTADENAPAVSAIDPAEGGPYTDMQGNPVRLADIEREALVVNSWASWCPFCVNELPDLSRLGEEYAEEGVRIVAINRKESPATARAFLEHIDDPEHVIFLLDESDFFYRSIGGFAMPETVFYDKEGNLVAHKRGFMELGEMRNFVEQVLAANDG